MARALTRCPGCGEPVSPFAAGCAICGTDLEAARSQLRSRRALALTLPRLPRISARVDPVHVVIAVLLAVAAPVLGLLLSLFWAMQRHRDGEPLMTAVMLATSALAATAFFAPAWFGRVL